MAYAPVTGTAWSLSTNGTLHEDFRRTTKTLSEQVKEVSGRTLYKQVEDISSLAFGLLQFLDAGGNVDKINKHVVDFQEGDMPDDFLYVLKESGKSLPSVNLHDLYSKVASVYVLCAVFLKPHKDNVGTTWMGSSALCQANPDRGRQTITASQALRSMELTSHGEIKQWTKTSSSGTPTTVLRHIEEGVDKYRTEMGVGGTMQVGQAPSAHALYGNKGTFKMRTLDEITDSEGRRAWEAKGDMNVVQSKFEPKLVLSRRQIGGTLECNRVEEKQLTYCYKSDDENAKQKEKEMFPDWDKY